MEQFIITCIASFVKSVCLTASFVGIYSIIVKKRVVFKVEKYLLFFVISATLYILTNLTIAQALIYPFVLDLICCLLLIPIFSVIFKVKLISSFFCQINYTVLIAIIELLLTLLFKLFALNNINIPVNATLDGFVLLVLANILAFIVVTIMKNKHFEPIDANQLRHRLKIILPQAILIFICICLFPIMKEQQNIRFSVFYILSNIFQIAFLIFICLSTTFLILKNTTHKQQLANTMLHNQTLLKANENIRGIKHDMGNIIQSILGYTALGDLNGIKLYCNNIVLGFNEINAFSLLSPEAINEPAIYGVVASKLLCAKDKCIYTSLDLNIDVKSINLPKYELSRILGILLDNAIEAAEQTEEKQISLYMHENVNEQTDTIVITNSISDINIDTSLIFEKDYSTKEKPSGFGLYEVKNYLKKYQHVSIFTSIDNDKKIFSQKLVIKR